MIALMITSLGAIMYSMGTYYKQEQWEEYTTLIEHVRQGTINLMDISLADYTSSNTPSNTGILKKNLDLWQDDLRIAYPGYGIVLNYDLANGGDSAYGTSINYIQGLSYSWNTPSSFSAAKTTMTLNMTSTGLEGYRFVASSFLELKILTIDPSSKLITATVLEDGRPMTGLKSDNFQVENDTIVRVTSNYDPQYILIYTIQCENLPLTSATLTVRDQRGIRVVAAK